MTTGLIGLGSLPDRGDAHWLGTVCVPQGGKTPYAWNDAERDWMWIFYAKRRWSDQGCRPFHLSKLNNQVGT